MGCQPLVTRGRRGHELTFADSVYRQIIEADDRGDGREVECLVCRLFPALEVHLGRNARRRLQGLAVHVVL